MTDELNAYRAIGREFADHQVVHHGREEYVRGEAHTNSVEGYFGNLKRGINGIYHHVGRKYLSQYLAEFDFRYNERGVSDGTRTITGIKQVEGKRLTLRTPKGVAEILMGND